MKDLFGDYKEYEIEVDGGRVVFLFNSGLCLDHIPERLQHSHSHYYNELFSVLRGEMRIETDSGIETVSAGETVLIPRELMHRNSYSDDIFRVTLAFLDTAQGIASPIHERLSEISCSGEVIRYKSTHFSDTLTHVIRYVHGDYDFCSQLVEGCLREILALVCQPADGKGRAAFGTLNDSNNYRNYVIGAVFDRAFSSTELPIRPPTLTELSRHLHLSEKQTDRVTRAFFGRSFREQVVYMKIMKAKELLRNTDMTVNEVSSAVGYAVTRCFFSAFKNETGMTPREYRLSVSNAENGRK